MRNDIPLVPFSELVSVNPAAGKQRGQVPYIGMSDVTNDGRLARIGHRLTSELTPGQPCFQDGDTLFAKITPCMENGKGAFVQGLHGKVGVGSTEFHVLRPCHGVEPKFVYYCTRIRAFRRSAEAMMTGSAGQRRVPPEFFRRYMVPHRTLSEQKRIVELLDAVDSLIEASVRAECKLQFAMEGIGARLLDWAPGRPPMDGWRLQKLEEMAAGAPICYGIVQAGPNIADGVPIVMIRDLSRGFTDLSKTSTSIDSAYTRSRIRGGDVLLSIKATIGRTAVVPTGFSGNISRDIARIRVSESHEPGFVRWMLSTPPVQRLLAEMVVGTTRAELSIATLKNIELPIPARRVQVQIMQAVNSTAESMVSAERERHKLSLFRRGIMDDLFTRIAV